MTDIRKAVFPVAGMGTRFLPATKATPKEMLPIVNKPLIQFAVEEALSAGIEQLIFITSGSKRAIEDHFDSHHELEQLLQKQNKLELLKLVQQIVPPHVSCVYVRQQEPLGLGHAVWCAKDIVGNQPFAVLLADDLIESNGQSCMKRMVDKFHQLGASILGVEEVPKHEVHKYGIVKLKAGEGATQIESIIEKPKISEAPSRLAAIGRYVLTPDIFGVLETVAKGRGNEIQLTDGIAKLLLQQPVHVHRLLGTRFDCGMPLGYVKATLNYALHDANLGDAVASYIHQLVQEQ